jgi:hypothetical protein
MDNQESHNDPEFVKLLKTCLKREIETVQQNLDGKENAA